MKKKNILIINEYSGSPEYGMNYRHYYLAKEFIALGYNVSIVSASYSHFFKKFPNMENKTYKNENIEGIDYLWIKVNKYSNSFDKKRVFKWVQFMSKLFFISKKLKNQPDTIIWSSTAPFSILSSYYLAKKYKVNFIFEVKDIWPLTLIEIGGVSKTHPIIKIMFWLEQFALNKADTIVSNLQNYTEHIKSLGINRDAHWVSNGIDIAEMQNIEPLDKKVKDIIPTDKFIVGYTGKIGISNAIKFLIETAIKLKDHTKIFFVIVGDGQEKKNLQEKTKNLTNILFIDSIKKVQIQSMLNLFDVCYIGWKKEFIYNYGVSPNKIFEYMYSGKPILHSISTPKDIVKLSNCGVSVEAENIEAISNAILELYSMSEIERNKLGDNGREYVLNHFTYEKLAEKYIKIIE